SLLRLRLLLRTLPTPGTRRDFWARAFRQVQPQEAASSGRDRARVPAWATRRARLAESMASRATLFATTGAALLLIAALALPPRRRRESTPAPAPRPLPRIKAAPIIVAEAINADSLIALPSQHGAACRWRTRGECAS